LIGGEQRITADVVNLILAIGAVRRIMSAVVPPGGRGFGVMVSRKPW
jgi:hypothetical protein